MTTPPRPIPSPAARSILDRVREHEGSDQYAELLQEVGYLVYEELARVYLERPTFGHAGQSVAKETSP